MKKVDDFQKLVRDELKANNLVSPFIHDIHETVDKLLSGKQSLVRYGDGEFRLMTENVDHVFQRHNSSLSERLKEILVSKDDRVLVGVHRAYFCKDKPTLKFIEDYYWKDQLPKFIKYKYMDFLDKTKEYYSCEVSIPMHHFPMSNDELQSFYDRIGKLIDGRDIIFVSGDSDILNYKHNFLKEHSSSVEFVRCPMKSAYEYIDRIRRYVNVINPSKERIVVSCLGPTATVLGYDLAVKDGMRTFDFGHLPREYFVFKSGIRPYTSEEEQLIKRKFFGS